MSRTKYIGYAVFGIALVATPLPKMSGFNLEGILRNPEGKEVHKITQEQEKSFFVDDFRVNDLHRRDINSEVEKGLKNKKTFGKILEKYPEEVFNILVQRWKEKEENVRHLEEALERGKPYFSDVKRIFLEAGLNEFEDYSVILPIVESHWRNITSSKGAEGTFQLTSATAKIHGGIISSELKYDERLSQIIAAQIAAKKIKSDFERMGNRDITLAAYNSKGLPKSFLKKRKREDISLRNYLEFLGKSHANPRLRAYAKENFYFLMKLEAVKEILEEKYPEILKIRPANLFEIISNKDSIYEVGRGDSLWRLVRDHLDKNYGSASNYGISKVVREISAKQNIGDHLLPGQEIRIPSPQTLRDIEEITGRELEEINQHIDPHTQLPEEAKIVVKKN